MVLRFALLCASEFTYCLVKALQFDECFSALQQCFGARVELGGERAHEQRGVELTSASQCLTTQQRERSAMNAAAGAKRAQCSEQRRLEGGVACARLGSGDGGVVMIISGDGGVVERDETFAPLTLLGRRARELERAMQVARALKVPATEFVVRIEARALTVVLRGGLVLAERGERVTAQQQRRNVRVVARQHATRVVERRRVIAARQCALRASQAQRRRRP